MDVWILIHIISIMLYVGTKMPLGMSDHIQTLNIYSILNIQSYIQ